MNVLCLALALQGPQVYGLEQLDLSAITQGWGSPQINKSVDGHPLKIGGVTFQKGVGTHAVSEWALRLNGKGLEFQASVGVDDEVEKQGSVEFEVWGDG